MRRALGWRIVEVLLTVTAVVVWYNNYLLLQPGEAVSIPPHLASEQSAGSSVTFPWIHGDLRRVNWSRPRIAVPGRVANGPSNPTRSFDLLGTAQAQGKRAAVLKDASTGEIRTLLEGESWGNCRLISVDSAGAHVSLDGRRVRLQTELPGGPAR